MSQNGIPADLREEECDPEVYKSYREMFTDHYHLQDGEWPRKGIKVPYSPLDIATLPKEDFDKHHGGREIPDNELNDLGKYSKPAKEGTSMRMVRDILHTKDPNFKTPPHAPDD